MKLSNCQIHHPMEMIKEKVIPRIKNDI